MSLDKDVWAGLFFVGLAILGLQLGADYTFGTTARVGPGFMPKLLCWAMLVLGGTIAVSGFVRTNADAMGTWGWGQLLAVLTAVLLFGATLENVGLEAAVFGAVMISSMVHPEPRPLEKAFLVFAALGLATHLWPGFVLGMKAKYGMVPSLAPLALGAIAAATALLTHIRRTETAQFLERMALSALLAAFVIVVFVDGLGLTMRSLLLLDLWTGLKDAAILPAIHGLRTLAGV